jgi:hypothetical protein
MDAVQASFDASVWRILWEKEVIVIKAGFDIIVELKGLVT